MTVPVYVYDDMCQQLNNEKDDLRVRLDALLVAEEERDRLVAERMRINNILRAAGFVIYLPENDRG
jgi:hypothetical protein